MPLPIVNVAASIVQAPDGRVLLAERTARQVAAGFWELPGGKMDPGETAPQAARRELLEEIGIVPHALRPWVAYEHTFPTKRVRLHFFRVSGWDGSPQGCEGQRLAWVDPGAPSVAPVLPSNERVLSALGLPQLCAVLRGADHNGPDGALAILPSLFAIGVRLLRLAEPQMAPDQRIGFARRVANAARPYGARILLEGTAQLANRAGADGLHATRAELHRLNTRPQTKLWSATCHDGADLAHAASLGADLAVLSPIQTCRQIPPRPALGWDEFASLARASPIPVYAQGGLSPDCLDRALAAGAAGIACSGAALLGAVPSSDNHLH